MKNKRFNHLDFIKSLAIIIIIITHVFSFHRSNSVIFFLWNYFHFVVVALVFSSGYVLFQLYKNKLNSFSAILSWYKKRLVRLILPFYYYLIVHYSLWYFFPNYFSGLGLKKNFDFIIQSILFTGGVDFNWFPLLFLQLTLLFPLILFSLRKKILLVALISLSAASTVYILLMGFPYSYYRTIMWLPWMSITILGIYFGLKESKDTKLINTIKRYLVAGSLAGFGFFLLFKFSIPQNKELILTQHKYPPDTIYLLYGVVITFFFLVVSRIQFIYSGIFKKIILYVSERSYQLFFIHYLVIDFIFKITSDVDWWSKLLPRTLLVILLSLVTTFIIYLFEKYPNKELKTIVIVIVVISLVFLWLGRKNYYSCPYFDKSPVTRSAILEWIQKPAAVRFKAKFDRTYISWIEHSGKIQIRYYDHEKKAFSKIYTVDDLYPDYGIEAQDDHNAPNMLILPDGQILLFYVVHDANDAFFIKASKNPEDITSWQERLRINDKSSNIPYNYPQAKKIANGEIILFYRRGIYNNSDEYFKISRDKGKSWSQPVKLIDFGKEGIYAFVHSNGDDIHIAWNRAVDSPAKKDIYYIRSPDAGRSWQRSDGVKVNLPLNDENSDLVFDSADSPAYVWDIVADEKNNPFIVFAHNNDPEHEYLFASRENKQWIISRITGSSIHYNSDHFFSGGLVFDPRNIFKVFLSKKHSKLEIESWISKDNGLSWRKSQSITNNSLVDNFRPQLVQDYKEDFKLIWSSGEYEGLVNSQWSGFAKVNIQSEVTKESIPTFPCR